MATLEFTTEDGVNGVYDRLIDAQVRILHGEADAAGEVRLVPRMQFVVRIPFETGKFMAKWAMAPVGKGRYAKVKLTLADRGVEETHVWELQRAYVHRLEEIEFPEIAQNETSQENAMQVVIRGVVANGQDYDGSSVLTMSRAQGGASAQSAETARSVADKLDRYLLNTEHEKGKDKAAWFDKALGFNKSNSDQLAKQIVFDEAKAVQTETNEYGIKYNQKIPLIGANGKRIETTFAWMRSAKDGIVRLVSAIPAKK